MENEAAILAGYEELRQGREPRRYAQDRQGRGRVPLVLGIIGALLLGLAGTAFAALTFLGGGGTQVEDIAPASTVALARLDTNPSLTQKINAFRLAQSSGDGSGGEGAGNQGMSQEAALVRALGNRRLADLVGQVGEFVGDRAGVAVLPDASGGLTAVAIAQVTDEVKARTWLDTERPDWASYGFRDGFVVVGSDQAVVDQVLASTEPLSADERFSSDRAELGSDVVGLVWADATAIATYSESGPQVGSNIVDSTLGSALAQVPDVQGRVMVGLSAQSDYVQVSAVVRDLVIGGVKYNGPTGATELLNDVPTAAIAGLGIGNLNVPSGTSLALAAPADVSTYVIDVEKAGLPENEGLRKAQGDGFVWVARAPDTAEGRAAADAAVVAVSPTLGMFGYSAVQTPATVDGYYYRLVVEAERQDAPSASFGESFFGAPLKAGELTAAEVEALTATGDAPDWVTAVTQEGALNGFLDLQPVVAAADSPVNARAAGVTVAPGSVDGTWRIDVRISIG